MVADSFMLLWKKPSVCSNISKISQYLKLFIFIGKINQNKTIRFLRNPKIKLREPGYLTLFDPRCWIYVKNKHNFTSFKVTVALIKMFTVILITVKRSLDGTKSLNPPQTTPPPYQPNTQLCLLFWCEGCGGTW